MILHSRLLFLTFPLRWISTWQRIYYISCLIIFNQNSSQTTGLHFPFDFIAQTLKKAQISITILHKCMNGIQRKGIRISFYTSFQIKTHFHNSAMKEPNGMSLGTIMLRQMESLLGNCRGNCRGKCTHIWEVYSKSLGRYLSTLNAIRRRVF